MYCCSPVDAVRYSIGVMLVALTLLPNPSSSFTIRTLKVSIHNRNRRRIMQHNRLLVQASKVRLSMAQFVPDKNNDVHASQYIPLDDVLLYDHPITCDPDFQCVSEDDTDDVSSAKSYTDFRSFLILVAPIVAPFIAFFTFELCAKLFSSFNDYLSQGNKWAPVDGGAYQARIIAPAINGLVVPAVALLFATLISTTITTLRQRQVEIRRAINMEAGELRAMECLFDAIDPGFVQDQCRSYVSFPFRTSFSIRTTS
jgi:Protein of unknown function (DUF4239)